MFRGRRGAMGVPGGRDGRRRGGFAEMGKDRAHGRGIGEESDDAHRAAAGRTHEWERFIDAGEQQRPGVAGGAPMGRFGGGGLGGGAGGGVVAATARAVTAARSGELGASTPK